MRVRHVAAITIAVLVFSCRDIQPFQPSVPAEGYQLKGTVTTPNGLPLGGVEVRVFYNYDLVQDTPIDTQQVIVRDSTKIVDVAVYTPEYRLVKELFLGYRSPGPVPRFSWNGFDENGVPVPNGKYLIRYVVDTVIIKYSTVIVDGHRTAVTDSSGRFTLTSDMLPVGEVFDHYAFNTRYDGTYAVLPKIDIDLTNGLLFNSYSGITLMKNALTTAAFILK